MTRMALSKLLSLSGCKARAGRSTRSLFAALLTLGALGLTATARAVSSGGNPKLPPGAVVNPISHFDITVDGKFTGGSVTNNMFTIGDEWKDITPLAFISPPTDMGTLLRTNVGDPNANSLLYAGLDPGVDAVYLMYDYLPRTNAFVTGDHIADIRFPITLPGERGPRQIDVTFDQTAGGPTAHVHADAGNGLPAFDEPADAPDLKMKFGLMFGPSTLSAMDHLLIELEVPLRIPAGFGPAFPQSGINPATGLYSPEPQFWGGGFTNNAGDPPGSAAIFTIRPDGSTLIVPQADVPEPSTWAFLTAGLLTLSAFGMRHKRREIAA